MKLPTSKSAPEWAGCLLLLATTALGSAQTTVSTGFEAATWATDGGYTSTVEVTSAVNQFQVLQGAGLGVGATASGGLRANMPLALTTTSRRSGSVRKQITSAAAASASLGTFETSIVISPRELDDTATGSRTGELRLGFSSDATAASVSAGSASSYLEANCIAVKLVAVHDNTTTNNRKLTLTLHNSSSSALTGSTLTLNDATTPFNDFLKLTLTIQRGFGNTYTASYRLEDLGPDGTGTPAAVTGLSLASPLALTNANLGAAASLYGAFVASGLTSPNTATTVKAALLLDNYSYTTTAGLPDAPVASAATAVTTTNLTAGWQAPTTGLNPQNYVLELTKADDNFAPNTFISASGATGQAAGITLAITVTSQVFTGLERGVSYVYRLRSTNATGASVNSNVTTAATSAVNLLPTLNQPVSQPSIYPGNVAPVTVALSGIGNGGDVGQVITVTATSSNTAVVPDPTVTYINPAATGSLVYTPTGTAGDATITVSASDGEDTVTRAFAVHVRTPEPSLGFDSEPDYSGEFVHAVSSTSITTAWSAAGGIGSPAGGGVVVNKVSTSSREALGYRRQTFNLVNQSYFGTSILINPKEWTGTVAVNGTLYVGFLGSTTAGAVPTGTNPFLSLSTVRSLGAQVNHNASSNQFELLNFNKASTTTGAAVGTASVVPGASTLKNNWLRLSVGFFPTTPGGTTFLAKARLENLGPDGTSAPVVLATNNQTVTNAAVAALTSAYAAYDVFLASANVGNTYLDNHEVHVNSNVPNAPDALAATVVTNASFNANWSPPVDSAYDSYVLEIVGADQDFVPGNFSDVYGFLGNDSGIAIPDRETLAFRLTNLDPATSFRYRVKAVNSTGSSSYSDIVSVTTLPEDGNLPPTLDPIPSPANPVFPGSAAVAVNLSGISDGGEGDQPLTVTAVSDNPSVVPDPLVSYTDGDATGSFLYTPGSVEGTAHITVTVTDGPSTQQNYSVSRTYTVIVRKPPLVVDFDSAADLSEFTLTHTGSVTEAFSATGGKGSPAEGGLKISALTSSTNSSGWRSQPYSFVGASSMTTSILINMKEWSSSSSKTKFALGFTSAAPGTATGTDFLGESPSETSSFGISVGFRLTSDAIGKLRVYNKKTGSSPAKLLDNDPSISASTLKTHWLKLTLSLTPTGATTFTTSYKLEDVGLTGLDAPVLVYNGGSVSVTDNSAILGSSVMYAAYNVFNDEVAGNTYLDDHQVEVLYSLAPPTANAASTIVGQAFTANWAPAAASYYTAYSLEVSKASDNFAPGTFVSQSGVTGQSAGISLASTVTSLRLTGLEEGTPYLYRVRASNPSVTSSFSSPVAVTTLAAGVNAAPGFDPVAASSSAALRTAPYIVNLTGINDGGEGNQTLSLTAVSDNPSVIADPVITYTSPASTAVLTYQTLTAGTANITVTLSDGQSNNSSAIRTFTVNSGQARELWSFEDSSDFTNELLRSATNYTAAWGATSGTGTPATGGVLLTSAAFSTKFFTMWSPQPYSVAGNTRLSTSVLVNMANISLTGELRLGFVTGGVTPGGATATTTGYLSSGTENAVSVSLQSYEKSSKANLQVRLLNKASSSSASATNTVSLSRSSAISQWLRVTLTLVPNGATTFSASYKVEGLGTDGTGTPTTIYTLTPVTITNAALAGATTAYGACHFTAGSSESGSIRFDDYRLAVTENTPPTLDVLSDVTLPANSAPQNVTLTGITTGGDSAQTLSLSATSSNTALVPTPTVVYTSPSATGQLQYSIASGQSGTSLITVTVDDHGAVKNLVTRTFLVTVNGMNPIETWRQQFFGSSANSGNGANSGDADQDGVSNLLEFATASDPLAQNGQPGSLGAQIENGVMVFDYVRSKAASNYGIIYVVEFTDDLTSAWSQVGVSQAVDSEDGTTQHIHAEIPAGAAGHRFVRLRVVNP